MYHPLKIAVFTLVVARNTQSFSLETKQSTDLQADFKVITGKSSLDIRGAPPEPIHSEPEDCGTWTIDCAKGAAACQNACYWHYCVMNWGENDLYYDGGSDDADNQKNRVLSGQEAGKTPCRSHPLVQLLFDPELTSTNWKTKDGPNLQTDEWPMAAMKQGPYADSAPPIRNSLRCIVGKENGAIGNQYRDWRAEQGSWSWAEDISPKERKRGRGKYGRFYNGGEQQKKCKGTMIRGDYFKIRFNLEGIDEPEKNVRYCIPPKEGEERDCSNDGKQFYMSKYRPSDETTDTSSEKLGPGKLGFPYDSSSMNTYRMMDSEQDLDEFKIRVRRTGEDKADFEVQVFHQRGGKDLPLSEPIKKKLTAVNDGLTVSDDRMPRDLIVTRKKDCLVSFLYGDQDDLSYKKFIWDSGSQGQNTYFSKTFPENKGLKVWINPNKKGQDAEPEGGKKNGQKAKKGKKEKWYRNPEFKNPGVYCDVRSHTAEETNDKKADTIIECWFAAP